MSLLFFCVSKKNQNRLVWHNQRGNCRLLLRCNNITSMIMSSSSSAAAAAAEAAKIIIPPSRLSIVSTSTSTSTSTTIMKKVSIYNGYKNRNNRNNIHLRPRPCNFSSSTSTSSSSSSNNDDSEAAPAPPVTSLDRLWKESTNRILKFDEKAKPINGKMNSLQWQLIETLILYWSTTTSTSSTRSSSSQSSQSSTTTFSSSTMSNNVDISLQLINRLAEERKAHIDSTDTTDTTSTVVADVTDFRTIDISLIHAMLKQWKECIQNQRRMNIHYNTNNNSSNNRRRSKNKNQQQQESESESESEKSIFKLIPSPFEMLQKIDYWNKTLSLVEPNIVTYTIIMDVSAITGSSSSGSKGDDFDNFTENLLYRLMEECQTNEKLEPTIVTIGTVIHSLANTKTLVGAQKAENWLRYLQTQQQSQQQQQQQQQQQGNNIGRQGAIVLKPNTIIYTTVMKAYADVGRVHKSEELLREMYTEYTIHHNQDVKPTLFTFNTVLGSYSKSKFDFENIDNAIQKSEELIQRMKDLSSKSKNITTSSSHLLLDVTPDIVSYNSVLSIIARRCSKSKIYRQRQQQREQKQQQQKKVLQSHSSIDTKDDVDDSLLLLQLLSKAEYWMEEILDKSSINNNEIVMPNQITYKILFNIIASMTATDASTTTTTISSSSNDKKEKAKQWLLRSNNTKLINDPILLKQINTM